MMHFTHRLFAPSTARLRTACACASLVFFAQLAQAQSLEVKNAWARATVQGQKATGAFMTLTSPTGTRLKSVASPVAGVAELHEMRMDGDVMKMAALKNGLELPAGKTIELKPGSYHLMLMDLKSPLRKDTQVPVTLFLVDAKGVESSVALQVPVRTGAPMEGMPKGHQH